MSNIKIAVLCGITTFFVLFSLDKLYFEFHSRGQAAYVRSHHCVREGYPIADTKMYSGIWGVTTSYGWSVYNCPNDIKVVIENDEEQP